MKKVLFIVIACLACATFTACAAPTDSALAAPGDGNPQKIIVEQAGTTQTPSINVSAEAEVTGTPDIAYITIGLSTTAKESAEAQRQNTEGMNAILDKVKAESVKDEDIQTIEYTTYPEYDYSRGKNSITGYTVRNRVSVKINDITLSGKIIDTASAAGSNDVSDIRFDIKDKEALLNTALKQAAELSRQRAAALASGGGLTLGKLLNLSYNDTQMPGSLYSMKGAVASDSIESERSTAVAPGIMTIRVTVNATYEVEN